MTQITRVKQQLDDAFTIEDLGELTYFLGIEVHKNKNGELLSDPEVYRRLVGRLLYLGITHPDLSYETQHLSQFLHQPRVPHLRAALHVLNSRFLSYAVFLGDSLVSWKTKKQATVSKSSAEAEYRSMPFAASELVWVEGLLQLQVPLPITIYCDNKSAEHMAHNPVFHNKTKHLKRDIHYIREQVELGFISNDHMFQVMLNMQIYLPKLLLQLSIRDYVPSLV
ncbi:uncharacterized protein LOC110711549 [Chenopodium quinoa]|uniref:uncharacterized protein LOC110711549 n=1 Tax=Chenopodium quinoa TaxID=63459 RepID=UPI000B784276|nr:uncharacterized protein LOC110711549 [Chenopodium quinoa]